MPNLYVVRRATRRGLWLMGVGGKENLMFVLSKKTDRSDLDDLVRASLAKQGITKDSEVEAIIEKGEEAYARRQKTQETIKELRRLMEIRARGGKLMQVGFRKWKQVFHPAVNRFKSDAV